MNVKPRLFLLFMVNNGAAAICINEDSRDGRFPIQPAVVSAIKPQLQTNDAKQWQRHNHIDPAQNEQEHGSQVCDQQQCQ
jgi:hypothetical protein